ncbi:MAG: hypothetical protein ACRDRE_15795 [Pseudonocardiaceae bacterium]
MPVIGLLGAGQRKAIHPADLISTDIHGHRHIGEVTDCGVHLGTQPIQAGDPQ